MFRSVARGWRGALWLSLALVVTLTQAVSANDLSLGPPQTPQSLMHNQLLVMARTLLGQEGVLEGKPRPDQLTRVRVLLDLAQSMDANDAELYRLRYELAGQTGEKQTRIEALSQYVKLRPDDDAAQLQLILALVEKHQTLDERVAAVERLLTSEGASRFSRALRSRLASYAAVGAREAGDTRRFAEHLKTALDLDHTNKTAAVLRVELMQSNNATQADLALALAGVMRADPSDASVHRALADMLLAQGAYSAAALQYTVADRLDRTRQDVRFYVNWALAHAASGNLVKALELVNSLESVIVSSLSEERTPSPADLMLPPDAELLRLMLYEHQDDTAKADGCFGRVFNALPNVSGQTPEKLALDQAWLRVLFNREVDEARKWFDAQAGVLNPEDEQVRRLEGWLAFRAGETQRARQLLEPLSEDQAAMFGLAQTYEGLEPEQYAQKLQTSLELAPNSVLALAAVLKLGDAEVAPKPRQEIVRVLRAMDEWPRVMVDPQPELTGWTQLELIAEHGVDYGFLDPQLVRMRLYNHAEVPLSLGPGATLPPTAFVLLDPRVAGTSLGDLPPLVVDLGRKLRLEPREFVEVPVRIDQAFLGLLMTFNPDKTYDYNVQVIYDPRFDHDRQLVRGMVGATGWLHALQRRGYPVTVANTRTWLAAVDDPDPVERMRNLARLCWLATRLNEFPETENQAADLARQIGDAVNRAFMKMNALQQAWVVRFIEPGEEGDRLFSTIHEYARRSDDRLLRVVYLHMHVHDPNAETIANAQRQGDPVIAEFASALKAGLQAPPPPKKDGPDAGAFSPGWPSTTQPLLPPAGTDADQR